MEEAQEPVNRTYPCYSLSPFGGSDRGIGAIFSHARPVSVRGGSLWVIDPGAGARSNPGGIHIQQEADES
jgi:hypothetical protein